jgi:hypothetical protein
MKELGGFMKEKLIEMLIIIEIFKLIKIKKNNFYFFFFNNFYNFQKKIYPLIFC